MTMNKDYSKLINVFEGDSVVKRLREIYLYRTIPEIFGICRSELAHSSFLAWLFNPFANDFGKEPLLLLLKLCNKKTDDNEELISEDITISNCEVETEKFVKNSEKSKGRVDIFIDCNVILQGERQGEEKRVMLIIENKVYSCEHDSQTNVYHEYFDKDEFDGIEKIYLFLTPPNHKNEADCKEYIHITYQDLMDNVFEPLLNKSDKTSRAKTILEEYVKSLTLPMDQLVDCDGTKTLKSTILAISMEEKELLRKFWDNHKDLIIAAINILAEDDNDEYSRTPKDLRNTISKRDYSKYSVNGDGPYGKGRMVEAVVNRYVKLNPQTTIQKLKEVFYDKLQGTVLIEDSAKNIKDMKRFYESTLPNETKFYISNQWGTQTDRFVEYVNNNIEGITVTKL